MNLTGPLGTRVYELQRYTGKAKFVKCLTYLYLSFIPDTFSMVTEGADGKVNITIPYHFSSSVKSATSSGQRTNAGRARRLAQEIASLSTSLPLSYSSSVFVRCDEERLDIMKVALFRDFIDIYIVYFISFTEVHFVIYSKIYTLSR